MTSSIAQSTQCHMHNVMLIEFRIEPYKYDGGVPLFRVKITFTDWYVHEVVGHCRGVRDLRDGWRKSFRCKSEFQRGSIAKLDYCIGSSPGKSSCIQHNETFLRTGHSRLLEFFVRCTEVSVKRSSTFIIIRDRESIVIFIYFVFFFSLPCYSCLKINI